VGRENRAPDGCLLGIGAVRLRDTRGCGPRPLSSSSREGSTQKLLVTPPALGEADSCLHTVCVRSDQQHFSRLCFVQPGTTPSGTTGGPRSRLDVSRRHRTRPRSRVLDPAVNSRCGFQLVCVCVTATRPLCVSTDTNVTMTSSSDQVKGRLGEGQCASCGCTARDDVTAKLNVILAIVVATAAVTAYQSVTLQELARTCSDREGAAGADKVWNAGKSTGNTDALTRSVSARCPRLHSVPSHLLSGPMCECTVPTTALSSLSSPLWPDV
jgi:hypothetical protein